MFDRRPDAGAPGYWQNSEQVPVVEPGLGQQMPWNVPKQSQGQPGTQAEHAWAVETLQAAASGPPGSGAQVRRHAPRQQSMSWGQVSREPHAMPSFHAVSTHASAPMRQVVRKTSSASEVRALSRRRP